MRHRFIAGVSVLISAYSGVYAIRFDVPELLGLAALGFVIAIFAAAMEQLLHERIKQVGKASEGHGSESSFFKAPKG
jgi:hypothetical protein